MKRYHVENLPTEKQATEVTKDFNVMFELVQCIHKEDDH
jgi:hypothetical protein